TITATPCTKQNSALLSRGRVAGFSWWPPSEGGPLNLTRKESTTMRYTNTERLDAIRELIALEAARLGDAPNDLAAAYIAAEFAFTVGKKSAYASAAHGVATIKRRLGIKREGHHAPN